MILEEHHIAGQRSQEQHWHRLRECTSCCSIAYPSDTYCVRCGTLLTSEPVEEEAQEAPPSAQRCGSCHTVIRHPVAFYCVHCGVHLDNESSM